MTSKNPWHLNVKDDVCHIQDKTKLIATVHVHFSSPETARTLEQASELKRLLDIVLWRLDWERKTKSQGIYFLSAFHDEISRLIEYIETGPGLQKEAKMSDKYYAEIAKRHYGLDSSDWSKEKLTSAGKALRKVK